MRAIDAERYLAAGRGGEFVVDRAEIAGDHGKQVARLRKRVFPHGKMAAVPGIAALKQVTVGQQHRRQFAVGDHLDLVDGQVVGPVEEIGDAAKAFGLALRAPGAAGPIESHKPGVLFRHDAHRCLQHETLLRWLEQGQRRSQRLIVAQHHWRAIDGQRLKRQFVTIEDERRTGFRAFARHDGEPRMHLGDIRHDVDFKLYLFDNVGRRRVVLEENRGFGVG
jgi:hypothetical protein